jgi:hypothetical protein
MKRSRIEINADAKKRFMHDCKTEPLCKTLFKIAIFGIAAISTFLLLQLL